MTHAGIPDAQTRMMQTMSMNDEQAGEPMQAGMRAARETMQKALEKVSSDLRK
jgi:hypothetical protein